jgi:hypothetical protein
MIRLIFILVIVALMIFLALMWYDDIKSKKKFPADQKITNKKPPTDAEVLPPIKEALRILMSLKTAKKSSTKKALAQYNVVLLELEDAVPKVIQERLTGIAYSAASVEEKLEKGLFDENKYVLFFALTDYVPSLINTYIDLPRKERQTDSKATEIVAEQLGIISGTISGIEETETQKILDDLKVRGDFIEERLKPFKKS